MRKISQISFRLKLVLSFAITFLVIYIASTVLLANAAYQRSLNDGKELLSLLTDQVLINIDQNISTTEKQVFNVYNALDIPEIMRNIRASNRDTSRYDLQTLQYTVNQMVSAVNPFDFVLLRTLDGHDVHTGGKLLNGDAVYQQASHLLDSYNGETMEWVRGEDSSVYLIRTIYSVSPLENVGEIIVRIGENQLLPLGHETEGLDSIFLLFDRQANCILTAGMLDPEGQTVISQAMLERWLSDGIHPLPDSDYYVVVRDSRAWSLVGMLPMEQLYGVRQDVWLTSLIIAAVGLLVGMLVMMMISKRLTRQLNVLTNSIEAVAVGDMNQIVPIYDHDDIGQIAIRFNNMTHQISELLQRVVSEEKHKNDAEFKMLEYRYRSLHTQINSHFIYNALETVNAFAKLEGNKDISKVVQLMSRYFRNNTKNTSRQYITLQQEFDYLRDYADIYQYIHGDRLVIKFECDEAAQEALLPTMILQPVLENALEHGMRIAKEKSWVCLSAQIGNEDILVIRIVDDGPGMSDEIRKRIFQPEYQQKDVRAGIGLRNVAERLKIIYGERANVSVESSSQGTCVEISLPCNYIAQLSIEID